MSEPSQRACDVFKSGEPITLSGGSHMPVPQIKVVKQKGVAVKSRRHDELLKQADYLEAQANRLAKMAREMRQLILTAE